MSDIVAERRTGGVSGVGRRVAENVRARRLLKAMSTYDLAEMMEYNGRPVGPTAITKIEAGTRRVDVDDLVALAYALGVTPSDLLRRPESCPVCSGEPPFCMTCNRCGQGRSQTDWGDAQ